MSRRRYKYRYRTDLVHGKQEWRSPFPVAVNVDPRHFKCPLPQSDAEFAVLAEIIFRVPLSLKDLWLWDNAGRAEIAQSYDSFHGQGFSFGRGEIAGYDRLGWFMQTVFGPINFSRSLTYTDFKRIGHRQWRRLEAWQESRRRGQSSSLRPQFVRLAQRFGLGENIEPRVDRRAHGVLTTGREDGAARSFAMRPMA